MLFAGAVAVDIDVGIVDDDVDDRCAREISYPERERTYRLRCEHAHEYEAAELLGIIILATTMTMTMTTAFISTSSLPRKKPSPHMPQAQIQRTQLRQLHDPLEAAGADPGTAIQVDALEMLHAFSDSM